MIGYLQKFNNLPQELKDKVSTKEIMDAIDRLEKKHNINLATVAMKVMVKDVSIIDLPQYFVFEEKMQIKEAEELVEEMKDQIFKNVYDYLGIKEKESLPSQADTKEDDKDEEGLKEWMMSKKKDTAIHSSNFFFSPDDEEEVKSLAKKYEGVSLDGTSSEDNEGKIDQIIKTLSIGFSSEDLNNRFRNVINTCLRGVRNKIETKHTLMKPVDTGGLGMQETEVNKVLELIKTEKEKPKLIKAPKKIFLPEDVEHEEKKAPEKINLDDKNIRDVGYDFSKLDKIETKEGEKSEEEKIDTGIKETPQKEGEKSGYTIPEDELNLGEILKEENEDKKEEAIKLEELEGAVEKPTETTDIKVKEIKPEEIKKPEFTVPKKEIKQKEEPVITPEKKATNIANVRKTAPVDGKVKMEDVKYVPKTLGPIDELAELDLINFRRLGQDAQASTAKIKEKIGYLEEESYAQRISGIKAWRKSPVNKLYLELGQESIAQKLPINKIEENRKNEGKDFLTEQEFDAIMDLNKDLRY